VETVAKGVSGAAAVSTGRRLGGLLAGYLALVMGAITLAPFQVRWPIELRPSWIVLDERWASDVLLNLVLFLPLGFILRRIPGGPGGIAARAPLVALVVSASIELAQLFLVGRYATVSDVVANTAGAWLGARLSDLVTRRLGEGYALVSRLLLDLPLMGFVYVLVPLLWLAGLAAGSSADRLWAALPLCCAGGLAMAAVAGSGAAIAAAHDRPVAAVTLGFAAASLVWYLLGAAPALAVSPFGVAIGAVLLLIVASGGRLLWRAAVRRDRRLEPQVVRVLLPLVLVHLAMLTWYGGGDLRLASSGEMARLSILRWLERALGYTALGYLIAEWRGRREETLGRALLVPVLVSVPWCMALGLTLDRAALDPAPALVTSCAAGLGALIYGLSRGHIIALRAPA